MRTICVGTLGIYLAPFSPTLIISNHVPTPHIETIVLRTCLFTRLTIESHHHSSSRRLNFCTHLYPKNIFGAWDVFMNLIIWVLAS